MINGVCGQAQAQPGIENAPLFSRILLFPLCCHSSPRSSLPHFLLCLQLIQITNRLLDYLLAICPKISHGSAIRGGPTPGANVHQRNQLPL
jgi:hypothetical protein